MVAWVRKRCSKSMGSTRTDGWTLPAGCTLSAWWVNWGAFVLAAMFAVVFSLLLILKHEAFNTRVYDLARFDQAIWNTLHGRFLFSTILNHSILGNHFSPYMAALSPLFLIWSDVRVLFIVQAVGMAVAGLFLYAIVRARHPALAPWFLLAFYLNPTLHEVTLYEFRRITLAVPYLALALYGLDVRRRHSIRGRWCMALGLGLALLCKEDVGFIVFMAGLYLLLFERDWKWGVSLMAIGAAWVVVVSLWVIPLFAPPGESSSVYPQLYYFDYLGESYADVLQSLLRDPLILVRQLIDVERLLALWRLFLPLGIFLPFLAPDWVLICLPTLSYLLLSNEPVLYRLEKWHLASVLPVLFAAIGVGLGRRSMRWARLSTVILIAATIVGFVLYSPAPLGGRYDPALYRVTAHHRRALEIVAAVPPDARVAAQVLYVPHLAHREHIYHYPWIVIGMENIDYLVLDRQSHPYPFREDSLNEEIDNLVADPSNVVVMEADGIYLLAPDASPLPYLAVDRAAGGTMALERVDVAVEDDRGFFQPADGLYPPAEAVGAVADGPGPLDLQPGQKVRVSLYWRALAPPADGDHPADSVHPRAERTVSVRIADSSGVLIAQHDGLPANGLKPTSWWEEGWEIRDVHYVQVSPDARPGPGRLEVVVYDSYSSDIVPFDAGPGSEPVDRLGLLDVSVRPADTADGRDGK